MTPHGLVACLVIAAIPAHAQPTGALSRTPSRTTSESVTAVSPAQAAAPGSGAAVRLPPNFDRLDDRATIVLRGKTVVVGDIRRAVNAQIARRNGPPKTVKAPKHAAPAARQTMATSVRTPSLGRNAQLEMARSPLVTSGVQARKTDDLRKLHCTHQGPPELAFASGVLTPGGKLTLSGYCLGNRSGRVEIIGQFPGGNLRPSFLSWNMTDIELAIPADIRGASDHAVAITVVTADGRRSSALQASFRAARERVAVPAARWAPSAGFAQASYKDDVVPLNPSGSGQTTRSLRIQRECALTDVEAYVTLGTVTGIEGFVEGANDADLKIAWHGACITRTTTTDFPVTISFESACAVAYEMRANAECPAGVAP